MTTQEARPLSEPARGIGAVLHMDRRGVVPDLCTFARALFLAACCVVGGLAVDGAHAAPGASPLSVGREPKRSPAHAAVRLRVAVGYGNIYRGAAWTPVRVTVRNDGAEDVSGTLEVPQADEVATGAQPSFHGLYQTPVTVPAAGTKNVTLYVPGTGIQGTLTVTLRGARGVLATASATPIGLDTSSLLIGALADGPEATRWIAPAIQRHVTARVVSLTPATIDPVAPALAAFDIIVVTNADTSQLDQAQLSALQQYVQNGGSVLLVGGPAWQTTLRPLQGSLLPGTLTGMRVLPDLRGALPLATGRVPAHSEQRVAVSVLSHARGTVLASQAGVPLVVRSIEGRGAVEYLAFDPSVAPVQSWPLSTGLTEHLLSLAAPLAISRTWSPTGFRLRFQQVIETGAVTAELGNLPPVTIPFLLLFAVLSLGYLLILGPASFLLLRRMRRQSLAWITLPALGVLYLGSIAGLLGRIKAGSAIVNAIGMVALGGVGLQPATIYVGLTTPMAGNYQVSYSAAALPAPLPDLNGGSPFSFRDASVLHATPMRMRLQEDPQTSADFLAMKRWSVRDLVLTTALHVPGTIRSGLTLDAHGNLVGPIHNGTPLDLLDPVLIAGQSIVHLRTLRAGATIHARIQPSFDVYAGSQSSLLAQAYGGDAAGGFDDFGGFRDIGDFSYPRERTLTDRVQNAAGMLSQGQADAMSSWAEVMLAGWTTRPIGTISVDGATPQRRDLTLVTTPLTVHFPVHGPFRLPAGTFGANLVDMLPRAPQSNCCGFGFGDDNQQAVSIGAGGFLGFEFLLGNTRGVRFRHLTLNVSSEDNGIGGVRMYSWREARWVTVTLYPGPMQVPDPDRFVSAAGQVMVRLVSTGAGGDLTVADAYHDVQLSGSGEVT